MQIPDDTITQGMGLARILAGVALATTGQRISAHGSEEAASKEHSFTGVALSSITKRFRRRS